MALVGWLHEFDSNLKVEHVYDVGLGGRPDRDVLSWATAHQAIVVTYDEDFADVRLFAVGSHAGVIRLRVWPTTIEQTQEAMRRLLTEVPRLDIWSSLVIVDSEKIRRRAPKHLG